ncbi:MAG: 50S ribosomal protein L23 [Bdellovibrionales bacterium]|nr:50S ribosomal protein L23 [Bdellovibrionales bacterium]
MAGVKQSPYDIVRRPRITEKAALLGSVENSVVFEVHPRATKTDIRRAVEKIFDVKVKAVRTMNCMGKVRRVGQKAGRRANWKKAYVSLQEGSSIDLIEGL